MNNGAAQLHHHTTINYEDMLEGKVSPITVGAHVITVLLIQSGVGLRHR